MSLIIKRAEFVCSSTGIGKCPKTDLPEYAFIGRSNVGKSSLINMLTNRNRLALISSTPGKTRLINHFLINNQWYLVDLPGYGYARTSLKQKTDFKTIITDYIINRKNLTCLFVLLDSRLEPQKIDLRFITWLGTCKVPFALILTKTDKISSNQYEKNRKIYESVLLETWEELPPFFKTSAPKKLGREDILDYINEINRNLTDKN
jgi:GTP-binding protein